MGKARVVRTLKRTRGILSIEPKCHGWLENQRIPSERSSAASGIRHESVDRIFKVTPLLLAAVSVLPPSLAYEVMKQVELVPSFGLSSNPFPSCSY
jgi:hypothetical protein